ncbi:unnamed protein product, partial [Mesorhabditis belari]|uniref:Peptidase M14 carboxypeptidase A domain-containing protein n=1 Tax=Mesorhabditis belari TaxID=2138241 RepID=A0AAF3F4M9_9BILA
MWLILLCLFLPITFANILRPERTSYSGYRLISFTTNKRAAQWLHYLEEYGFNYAENEESARILVDIFSEPSRFKKEAVVLVAPEFYGTFSDYLRVYGVTDMKVIKEDVQRDLEMAARYGAKRRVRRQLNKARDFKLDEYHSYDEMIDYMRKLSEENEHVELINVGISSEEKTLYGIKIFGDGKAGKPSVFVDAGVHAREWIAPAAALVVIDRLAAQYGNNDTISRVIDKFDWYIVPQTNPDGYEYSRTTDRLWRKTRSRNMTVNKWCVGADANRNWGYRWGGAGANRSPCSTVYAGSHPFSEPEIRGLKEYITWNIPQLTIYASLHSYGQVLLSPWGYTDEKPDNYQDQKTAATLAINAIKNTTGSYYTHGTISELMYPASGTSIDFMQNRGVPYIYGVELRPTDSANSFAFSLPPTFIESTGEEMLAALLALADYATVQKRL